MYGITPTTTGGFETSSTNLSVVPDHDHGLPVTGGDVVGLGLVGASAMIVASVMVRRRRVAR